MKKQLLILMILFAFTVYFKNGREATITNPKKIALDEKILVFYGNNDSIIAIANMDEVWYIANNKK